MTICKLEALIFIFEKLWLIQKIGQMKDQKVKYQQKDLACITRNIYVKKQSSAITIQILLAKLLCSKVGQTQRSRSQSKKCLYYWRVPSYTCIILMWNIKALALAVQKLLNKIKVSDRFTKWQKDGTTEWQTAANTDSSSQAYLLNVFPKVW